MKEHLACNIKPAARARHPTVRVRRLQQKQKEPSVVKWNIYKRRPVRLGLSSAIKSRLIFIIRAPAKSFAARPSADKKRPRWQ